MPKKQWIIRNKSTSGAEGGPVDLIAHSLPPGEGGGMRVPPRFFEHRDRSGTSESLTQENASDFRVHPQKVMTARGIRGRVNGGKFVIGWTPRNSSTSRRSFSSRRAFLLWRYPKAQLGCALGYSAHDDFVVDSVPAVCIVQGIFALVFFGCKVGF